MFHRENRIRQQSGGEPIREAQVEATSRTPRVLEHATKASRRGSLTTMIRTRTHATHVGRNARPDEALGTAVPIPAQPIEVRARRASPSNAAGRGRTFACDDCSTVPTTTDVDVNAASR